jgi:hypothetical protein
MVGDTVGPAVTRLAFALAGGFYKYSKKLYAGIFSNFFSQARRLVVSTP